MLPRGWRHRDMIARGFWLLLIFCFIVLALRPVLLQDEATPEMLAAAESLWFKALMFAPLLMCAWTVYGAGPAPTEIDWLSGELRLRHGRRRVIPLGTIHSVELEERRSESRGRAGAGGATSTSIHVSYRFFIKMHVQLQPWATTTIKHDLLEPQSIGWSDRSEIYRPFSTLANSLSEALGVPYTFTERGIRLKPGRTDFNP